MSSLSRIAKPERVPLIALVDRASQALQRDMVKDAHDRGYPDIKYAHNAVFSTLGSEGSRATDMASQAGITRQSMGEIVREMVGLGYLEMKLDPDDRRAKLVTYTDYGLAMAREGFQHIIDLEQQLADKFGEDYEVAREVLEKVLSLVDDSAPIG